MPHEKINYVTHVPVPDGYAVGDVIPATDEHPEHAVVEWPWRQLVVGWNEIGWVQVSIYPEGWSSTGDAMIVDLNPQELDLLIRTLRRAKRQAYGGGNRHFGFQDGPAVKSQPLWPDSPTA